ncbi:MAG: hypothetical protein COB85_00095 [Bacteroidetes bacterium]|nr:MAG: hypothetical protein COB85_00095 [Bacteroidota bacterium]
MKLASLLISSFLVASTWSGDRAERIGVPGPIEFNETIFELKWTDKPSDYYYIQEYLPRDETLEKFNQMITCHVFITDLTVEEAVQQKANELDERKKNDPNCNYLVNKSPDGKELMLDCILGEHTEKDIMIMVEFIIYRYKRVKLKKGKRGILVFAYSKRSYGDDIMPFLTALPEARIKHLNQMLAVNLPEIRLK